MQARSSRCGSTHFFEIAFPWIQAETGCYRYEHDAGPSETISDANFSYHRLNDYGGYKLAQQEKCGQPADEFSPDSG